MIAAAVVLAGCSSDMIKIEVTGDAEEMILIPNAVYEARPAIHNVGNIDVFCFFEVTMPMLAEDVPLVEYETTERWTLIREEAAEGCQILIYAYDAGLAPGEDTDPLFTSWRVVDFSSGEADELADKIAICGYAIQTAGFEHSTPEQRWEAAK